LRNYWFERDGDNFNTGGYESESSVGEKNAHFAVEDFAFIQDWTNKCQQALSINGNKV